MKPFQESEVKNHLKESLDRITSLHTLASTINQKYEKLKDDHSKMHADNERLREENNKKEELVKSLKEEIKRLNSR